MTISLRSGGGRNAGLQFQPNLEGTGTPGPDDDTLDLDRHYRVDRADRPFDSIFEEVRSGGTESSFASSMMHCHAHSAGAEVNESYGIFKTHCNFGGAYTHNYFMVSAPIQLKAIYFYGPYDNHEEDFTVELTIYEGVFPDDGALKLCSVVKNCIGRRNELMVVELTNCPRVFCRPKFWYTVQFRIDGAQSGATWRMKGEPKIEIEVHIPGFGPIKFQFLRGSMQMPEMEFRLIAIEDEVKAHGDWARYDILRQRQHKASICDIIWEYISSFFL